MGMGTGNPRIMKPGMGRGEKSPNPHGDPRSPVGTGMGMKSDSPTRMGMRLINGDGDAHRQWYSKLTSALIENGFSQSKSDYSLYTKSGKGVFLVLLVYVDDIIITSNSVS
ncbi:ribonuclease H-like domain-containing protein [Tanacetum coccineum]